MIRLGLYPTLLVFFADMLRRAWIVSADSLVLPIFAICIWLLVLIVRAARRTRRRLTRKRTAFIRVRSFPGQPRRPLR